MTGPPVLSTLWFLAYAGMTVGFAKVSIKREGDGSWCCLVQPCHPPPCGYCLKASMTVPPVLSTLWFLAYAGMTGWSAALWIADQVRNDKVGWGEGSG